MIWLMNAQTHFSSFTKQKLIVRKVNSSKKVRE